MSRSRFWNRARNLSDRPFAAALGILLLASSIAALAHVNLASDVLEELVPEWVLIGLAVTYGMGGLFIIAGIAWRKSNLEAAGCILTLAGLIIRIVAMFSVLGVTIQTSSTILFYAVFGWACMERIRQILVGDSIVRVHNEYHLEFMDDEEDVDDSGK